MSQPQRFVVPSVRAESHRALDEERCASAEGSNGVAQTEVELGTFLRAHRAALARLCVFWTRGNGADADDLLSDACLRTIEALRRGSDGVVAVRAWWSVIIGNLGRDRLRARSRRPWDSGAPHGAAVEAVADAAPDSERLFAARRELSTVLRLLNRIPAAQRAALVARGAGNDYTEIAVRLGTSPANARKLVQLGRAALRLRMSRAAAARRLRHAALAVPRSNVTVK